MVAAVASLSVFSDVATVFVCSVVAASCLIDPVVMSLAGVVVSLVGIATTSAGADTISTCDAGTYTKTTLQNLQVFAGASCALDRVTVTLK